MAVNPDTALFMTCKTCPKTRNLGHAVTVTRDNSRQKDLRGVGSLHKKKKKGSRVQAYKLEGSQKKISS